MLSMAMCFSFLMAMDTVQFLNISAAHLEKRLHEQSLPTVEFNSALKIFLPVYFQQHYCNNEVHAFNKMQALAKDKELLAQNIKNLRSDVRFPIKTISFTPSFFDDYPQKFAYTFECRRLIVDGEKTYQASLNHIWGNKFFWLNKTTALEKSTGQLQLVLLNKKEQTFSGEFLSIHTNCYVAKYAQHPFYWNQFYTVLNYYGLDHYEIARISISNNAISDIQVVTKLAKIDESSPIQLTLPDCAISIIMSPYSTFYILGRKSYQKGGTRFTLDPSTGSKRLVYVNKAVQKDFIKAVMNRKTTIAQRDHFFENHHLRRNFLEHWISYKIKKIEEA